MRTLRTLLFIGSLILVFGCDKKKYPETLIENNAVFYTKFTLGGSEQEIDAGASGNRLYPSYLQDANNIYHFISEIKSPSCINTCPNSIKIEIKDSVVRSINAPVDINKAIHTGFYGYQTPSLEVQFQSQYNKTAVSYLWNFGDGYTSLDANPKHIYKTGGTYDVYLSITGSNGCESVIRNKLKIGVSEGNCMTSISANATSLNSVSFDQTTSGKAPFEWDWEFGDGSRSTFQNPVHNYAISGSYPVRLRVIDAGGDTAYANYNVVTANDLSSCSANMKATSVQSLTNTISFSDVIISYVDASGLTFRSDLSAQPSISYFEILSVEDYENNDNGAPTKKLHVKFDCKLFNGAKSLSLKNAEAVICVAYKN